MKKITGLPSFVKSKYYLLKQQGVINAIKYAISKVPIIKSFYNYFFYPIITDIRINRCAKKENSDVLFAVYDLEAHAASFDFVHFLIRSDTERKRRNLKSLFILIIPGTTQGFASSFINFYVENSLKNYNNIDFLKWRVKHILIPSSYLMPSCSGITLCISRCQGYKQLQKIPKQNIFPTGSSIVSPISIYNNSEIINPFSKNLCDSSIIPSETSLRFIKQWIESRNLENKKLVTITFRESSNDIGRNSNILEWIKFTNSLDLTIFHPVIVRDTEVALEPNSDSLSVFTIFSEVPWNIELRAALYHVSYLNMFTASGPSSLAMFNSKCRFLSFKIITPSSPVATSEHIKNIGIPVDSQLEFFSKFQKQVWEDDTFEVISREFQQMVRLIENNC